MAPKMASSCRLLMILFSFVTSSMLLVNGLKLLNIGNVDNYHCTERSPVEEPYFSRVTPKDPLVAITHIFCGQIRGNKAEGFHSRPGDVDPDSAVVQGYISSLGKPSCYCPQQTKGRDVKIWNANSGQYISRTNDNRNFIFFPPSWKKSYTVKRITEVFHYCLRRTKPTDCVVLPEGGNLPINQICQQNYEYPGCSKAWAFRIFLQDVEGEYRVVTAFPDTNCPH